MSAFDPLRTLAYLLAKNSNLDAAADLDQLDFCALNLLLSRRANLLQITTHMAGPRLKEAYGCVHSEHPGERDDVRCHAPKRTLLRCYQHLRASIGWQLLIYREPGRGFAASIFPLQANN